METITISTVLLGKMIWMLFCLKIFALYIILITTIAIIRQWPYRKTIKKFKKICKLKHINLTKQECIIIEKFVEEYENKIHGNRPTEIKYTKTQKEQTDDSEPKWYPNGWYLDEKTGKWTPPDYVEESSMEHGENLVYNEKIRMWVNKDQCDPVENQRKYEENRKRWQEFEERERKRQQTRQRVEAVLKESNNTEDPSRIEELYFGQYDRYSDFTDEELKLILQTKQRNKEPTYEEWKAAKLKKQQEEQKHPED